MTRNTKIALAALLIGAFATPSFARDYQTATLHYAKHEPSYRTLSPRLIEGRNSAAFGVFSKTFTDRESIVQTLGN
jgi:hypothetical protein